jgi:hypothetical protein
MNDEISWGDQIDWPGKYIGFANLGSFACVEALILPLHRGAFAIEIAEPYHAVDRYS